MVLRCYQYEEAFFAELKVREKYDFPQHYFEELYNCHRDESYTYLTLSKAEKLCCITFEMPDHTLSEVFASVSTGGQRSQKWIEKCWIVLKQIATTLKYLHNQNLIHGHLDAANIAKYGNIWKIAKLGTVTRVGTPMRGTFRSCVPPESIVVSTSSSCPNLSKIRSQLNDESKSHISAHRVKFSRSIEEPRATQLIKGQIDDRDDTLNISSSPDLRQGQGNEHNSFMSFLGLHSPSLLNMGEHNHEFLPKMKKGVYNSHATFAPEKCKATPQWDMWGFGLIMVQLLLGRSILLPNFETAEDAILKKLYSHDEETLRKICTQLNRVAGHDASDLVMLLLQKDPSLRPKSFEEVLAHKYFQVLTIYV